MWHLRRCTNFGFLVQSYQNLHMVLTSPSLETAVMSKARQLIQSSRVPLPLSDASYAPCQHTAKTCLQFYSHYWISTHRYSPSPASSVCPWIQLRPFEQCLCPFPAANGCSVFHYPLSLICLSVALFARHNAVHGLFFFPWLFS